MGRRVWSEADGPAPGRPKRSFLDRLAEFADALWEAFLEGLAEGTFWVIVIGCWLGLTALHRVSPAAAIGVVAVLATSTVVGTISLALRTGRPRWLAERLAQGTAVAALVVAAQLAVTFAVPALIVLATDAVLDRVL
jgi:hypothetical protein